MNLLAAKIYFDGSHYIAIPHTERPCRKKRQRQKPKKSEEVQQFEQRFEKVKGLLFPPRQKDIFEKTDVLSPAPRRKNVDNSKLSQK